MRFFSCGALALLACVSITTDASAYYRQQQTYRAPVQTYRPAYRPQQTYRPAYRPQVVRPHVRQNFQQHRIVTTPRHTTPRIGTNQPRVGGNRIVHNKPHHFMRVGPNGHRAYTGRVPRHVHLGRYRPAVWTGAAVVAGTGAYYYYSNTFTPVVIPDDSGLPFDIEAFVRSLDDDGDISSNPDASPDMQIDPDDE